MIKLEIVLDEETLQEIFEGVEVKFSKKKMKELKELVNESELDILEVLEESLKEQLEEMITDNWER